MILENVDLLPYNTFGITAKAKYFARFSSVEELKTILKQRGSNQLLILGGGSNVLFTQDFDGLVLKNEIKGISNQHEENNQVIVEAGAGEVWHDFVLYCIENNLAGVENLSLIPGSVGASPMQNIGAYGVEIKDVFHSLDAFEIETGNIRTFTKEECEFGYRESVFKTKYKNKFIIIKVRFNLSRTANINTHYGAIEEELAKKGISSPSIKDVSDAVISIRQSKLPNPAEIGNAGSFFKNPVVSQAQFEKIQQEFPSIPFYKQANETVKIPAGWLIEQAGWKGKRFSNFGVHDKQALVLVNYSNATGSEIYDLSSQILSSIEAKFGVLLEREVNVF
jgi:UDP-N-acetylmuramate dehydrogenase